MQWFWVLLQVLYVCNGQDPTFRPDDLESYGNAGEQIETHVPEISILFECATNCDENERLSSVKCSFMDKTLNSYCEDKNINEAVNVMVNGENYVVITQKISWFGAKKFCESKGLQFGSINNVSNRTQLIAHIQKIMQIQTNITDIDVWMPLSSLGSTNNKFQWENNKMDIDCTQTKKEGFKCCSLILKSTTTNLMPRKCSDRRYAFCSVPKCCSTQTCYKEAPCGFPSNSDVDSLNGNELTRLRGKAASLLNEGDNENALIAYEELIQKEIAASGTDSTDTLNAMLGKASALSSLNFNKEALILVNEIYDKSIKHNGINHPDTINTILKRADIFNDLEQYKEAFAEYESVVKIQIVSLGEEHPETLGTMFLKAVTGNSFKNPEDAIADWEELRKLEMNAYGENDVETLPSLDQEAALLVSFNRFADAAVLYDKILQIKMEEYGPENLETVFTMHMKVDILSQLGKYIEALDVLDSIINYSTVYGNDIQADALLKKSLVIIKLKKYREATDLLNTIRTRQQDAYGTEDLIFLKASALVMIMNANLINVDNGMTAVPAESEIDEIINKITTLYGEDSAEQLDFMEYKVAFLKSLGKYDASLALISKVCEIRKANFGVDNLQTILTLQEKANILYLSRKINDALKLYDDILKLVKTQDEKNPTFLQILHDKAIVLADLRRFNDSISLFDRVIRARIQISGDNSIETLNSMHFRASVLLEMYRYDEALIVYDIVIDRRKTLLSENNPDTINSMQKHAETLTYLEKYNEALLEYEILIPLLISQFGHNAAALKLMHDRAEVFYDLGQYQEAKQQFEEVITYRSDLLGPDHVHTLSSKGNRAAITCLLSDCNTALTEFIEILNIFNKTREEGNTAILDVLHNHAWTLHQLKRYDEALKRFDYTIQKQLQLLGPNNRDMLGTIKSKCLLLIDLERFNVSLTVYTDLAAKQIRILGANHSETLKTMHQRALMFQYLGKYTEALDLFGKIVKNRTQIFGANDPETFRSEYERCVTLTKLGKYSTALDGFKKLLQAENAALGKINEYSYLTEQGIALCHSAMNSTSAALQMIDLAINSATEWFGSNSVNVFNVMKFKAEILDKAKQYKEAIFVFDDLITKRRNLLGANHKDTVSAMHFKAVCLGKANRVTEAIKLLDQVITLRKKILGDKHVDTLTSINEKNRLSKPKSG